MKAASADLAGYEESGTLIFAPAMQHESASLFHYRAVCYARIHTGRKTMAIGKEEKK